MNDIMFLSVKSNIYYQKLFQGKHTSQSVRTFIKFPHQSMNLVQVNEAD